MAVKNFGEAMECFDQALKIDQKYIQAHLNKGVLNMQLLYYELAIEIFDKLIIMDE